ncbi:hypothetical protein ACPSKX_16175 [Moritella viscosa]
MASCSIEKRVLASKELRFKAVVIVKNKGAIIHRESKTFKKKVMYLATLRAYIEIIKNSAGRYLLSSNEEKKYSTSSIDQL